MWFVTILPFFLFLVSPIGVGGDGHPNLGLLPNECGFIDGERMPDSKYARLYEFPWMAGISLISQDGGRDLVCSGTVINERYVLTVGHCGKRLRQSTDNQVRIGDYDRQHDVDCEGQGPTLLCEDQFQDIDVEEVIVHEGFSLVSEIVNDIALLRLKTPIDFSYKNAAPVCLPLTTELQNKTLTGQEAIVAGWELMIDGLTNSKLVKLNIPVRDSTGCPSDFHRDSKQNQSSARICTGGVESVCPLESGSPLMLPTAVKEGYRYVQYGITASGTWACNSKQWSDYTDVSKYVDWILNNLKA